ncbi:YmaF family protein [Paenibacillus alba]|uniref:YmaF family protein n=1 Tax=Paenibacillus alba TaxID=1197127 RepID=A0ABU6G9K4_9BACL|nr:YmaF family protein [Paenibacillus alba]MEC0230873.1 YmaF family protein [Paenibacillus alba]
MTSCIPPAHVHFFKSITSEELKHHHLLRVYTFSVNGTANDGHVHQYQGITGIRYGHYHNYFGISGPAIALQNGTHIHLLEGIVELNAYNTSRSGALVQSAKADGLITELHQHSYSGYSTIGMAYETW